jgi:hypothetical protein
VGGRPRVARPLCHRHAPLAGGAGAAWGGCTAGWGAFCVEGGGVPSAGGGVRKERAEEPPVPQKRGQPRRQPTNNAQQGRRRARAGALGCARVRAAGSCGVQPAGCRRVRARHRGSSGGAGRALSRVCGGGRPWPSCDRLHRRQRGAAAGRGQSGAGAWMHAAALGQTAGIANRKVPGSGHQGLICEAGCEEARKGAGGIAAPPPFRLRGSVRKARPCPVPRQGTGVEGGIQRARPVRGAGGPFAGLGWCCP